MVDGWDVSDWFHLSIVLYITGQLVGVKHAYSGLETSEGRRQFQVESSSSTDPKRDRKPENSAFVLETLAIAPHCTSSCIVEEVAPLLLRRDRKRTAFCSKFSAISLSGSKFREDFFLSGYFAASLWSGTRCVGFPGGSEVDHDDGNYYQRPEGHDEREGDAGVAGWASAWWIPCCAVCEEDCEYRAEWSDGASRVLCYHWLGNVPSWPGQHLSPVRFHPRILRCRVWLEAHFAVLECESAIELNAYSTVLSDCQNGYSASLCPKSNFVVFRNVEVWRLRSWRRDKLSYPLFKLRRMQGLISKVLFSIWGFRFVVKVPHQN